MKKVSGSGRTTDMVKAQDAKAQVGNTPAFRTLSTPCAGCNQPGGTINSGGNMWHPKCLRASASGSSSPAKKPEQSDTPASMAGKATASGSSGPAKKPEQSDTPASMAGKASASGSSGPAKGEKDAKTSEKPVTPASMAGQAALNRTLNPFAQMSFDTVKDGKTSVRSAMQLFTHKTKEFNNEQLRQAVDLAKETVYGIINEVAALETGHGTVAEYDQTVATEKDAMDEAEANHNKLQALVGDWKKASDEKAKIMNLIQSVGDDDDLFETYTKQRVEIVKTLRTFPADLEAKAREAHKAYVDAKDMYTSRISENGKRIYTQLGVARPLAEGLLIELCKVQLKEPESKEESDKDEEDEERGSESGDEKGDDEEEEEPAFKYEEIIGMRNMLIDLLNHEATDTRMLEIARSNDQRFAVKMQDLIRSFYVPFGRQKYVTIEAINDQIADYALQDKPITVPLWGEKVHAPRDVDVIADAAVLVKQKQQTDPTPEGTSAKGESLKPPPRKILASKVGPKPVPAKEQESSESSSDEEDEEVTSEPGQEADKEVTSEPTSGKEADIGETSKSASGKEADKEVTPKPTSGKEADIGETSKSAPEKEVTPEPSSEEDEVQERKTSKPVTLPRKQQAAQNRAGKRKISEETPESTSVQNKKQTGTSLSKFKIDDSDKSDDEEAGKGDKSDDEENSKILLDNAKGMLEDLDPTQIEVSRQAIAERRQSRKCTTPRASVDFYLSGGKCAWSQVRSIQNSMRGGDELIHAMAKILTTSGNGMPSITEGKFVAKKQTTVVIVCDSIKMRDNGDWDAVVKGVEKFDHENKNTVYYVAYMFKNTSYVQQVLPGTLRDIVEVPVRKRSKK